MSQRREIFMPGKAIFAAMLCVLQEKLTKHGVKIAAGEAF